MKTPIAIAASRSRTRAGQALMVVAGTFFMALGAHVAIPTPFSSTPITGQTLALALVVALLGTRGATLAMMLYIGEGLAGLPVYSQYGLLGPSMGYILAFPVAAFVTGWLFDRGWYANYGGRAIAILAGTAIVFAGGASWLASLFGWPVAFATGVVPFVIGDIVKTLVAAGVTPFVRDAGKVVPQI